jgi:vitamin B12 transporter
MQDVTDLLGVGKTHELKPRARRPATRTNIIPVLEEEMRKTFGFIIFACLQPVASWAQRDTVALDSVTVTAMRRAGSLVSTAPVQALDASQMLSRGVQTLTDALKHFSGITVRDYGGAGGMKTVSVRGIGSKHTGVVYDGLTVTDCQTGAIDLSRFSLDNVGGLRLVIGDADNIFEPARNQASAATLHLDTRYTDRPLLVSAKMTAGSWSTFMPSLFVGGGNGRGLQANVMGEYLVSDNDYPFTLYNGRLTSRQHRSNSRLHGGHVEANLRYQWRQGDELSVKAYYYDNHSHLPGIVHLYTQDNDNEQQRERNAFAQAVWVETLSPQWALKWSSKFTWNATLYHRDVPSGGVKSENYFQREWYTSAALLYAPTSWLSADYSVDYAYNNLNSTLQLSATGTSGSGAISSLPRRHTLLQSLTAKAQWNRLTAIARLLQSNYVNEVRAGEASAGNDHRWSPSVSLSWQPFGAEQLRLRAFWKSIFREPNFNELYYYHLGSATLRPEKTSQWDLGVTWDSGCHLGRSLRLLLTLDGYVASVHDKIQSVPFNMFIWRTINLSKTRTLGADLTMDLTWTLARRHSLELTANYTCQRVQDRDNSASANYNNQIAYTPENTFGSSLTWMNPWANVVVSFDGMDERWTTNDHAAGTRMAGYGEMDLSLWRQQQMGRCRMTLRASLLNVTDKQYELVAYYPMPGRSWRVSVGLEF